MTGSRALVFGGTGVVGSAVLQGLARARVPTVFTYHESSVKAEAMAAEYSQRAVRVDLAEPQAIRSLIEELDREETGPDLFIHCAARSQNLPLDAISDDAWYAVQRVNVQAAFVACQALAPRMASRQSGHVVLVGAIGRAQSIPLPVHFAASQGALAAMTMALGKELGPRGIRVNMVALGLLEGGLSREISPKLVADYKNFSALRRAGTPEEAARAILWLALENTYMNGEVLPVNGGL
ncbi:MAG TPA: SDR family oxidoreductase [Polyangiaceae bacterium]|nr:SDR family oxidoreductase [Polyangiaceae bacterium]